MSAAELLKGLVLDGQWTVIERLKHQPSSGGVHSVAYIVHDLQGRAHFLKAFDFSSAFEPDSSGNTKDIIRELQLLTAAYEHEREILDHCKSRRLSGVVIAVTYGYVQVAGMSAAEGTVYYLIFELADGDVRRQVDVQNRLDTLWCLKILDDVTLGLWQIHREAIAHQDLKPSNVLVYRGSNCRIADFGRSSRRGRHIWIDDLRIAGDGTYAPPEQLYGFCHPDFVVRRLGCDLYLLGNLAAFLFSGVNITSAIFSRLDSQFHPRNWGGTYEQVLPHIQRAFDDSATDLTHHVDKLVRDDLLMIVRELCNPDLLRRGHPKGLGRPGQYSLERYKARTDLLLKKATVASRIQKSA